MRGGYTKRPPCFCRVCVCVCVCGSVEHYGLLSVSKLKRSPTLASFNVAQAAGMELQSPSLPFSTGLYCIALHSPHAVVVLACTALHCSAIFRRQGVVGRYVQYVCRRKHRHTCPHKHPHTHIAAPIRQLDVHPGISYMDRQVPSMRHTPIATGLCPQHMHLYSNRPPALHRWTGGHPGQPVGEATYAA
jgi:hypothetical protein